MSKPPEWMLRDAFERMAVNAARAWQLVDEARLAEPRRQALLLSAAREALFTFSSFHTAVCNDLAVALGQDPDDFKATDPEVVSMRQNVRAKFVELEALELRCGAGAMS